MENVYDFEALFSVETKYIMLLMLRSRAFIPFVGIMTAENVFVRQKIRAEPLARTIGTLFLTFYSIGNLHKHLGYKLSVVTFGSAVFGLISSLHHRFMRINESENFSGLA